MKLCQFATSPWLLGLWLGLASIGALAADAQPKPSTADESSRTQQPAAKTPTEAPMATRGNDQLILDSTLVTGNRELPKVMYIVPWKKADLSNLPGQPFNTLIDETLAPIDRDVFQREVAYYQVIADKDRAATDQAAPSQKVSGQATPAADRK